jgi:hypothetical protein
MIELWFLLLSAATLGFVSLYRLLVDRFPHPADLATIAVFYYTLPLAIAATLFSDLSQVIFLHSAASNYDLALESMFYAVLAGACLQLGRWIGSHLAHRPSRVQFALTAGDLPKTSLVLLFLLGAIGLGVVLFGTDAFFAGYNVESQESTATLGTATVYLSIEWLGFVMVCGVLASRATSKRLGWGMITLTIAVLLFLGAARGKRLEIICAALPVGLVLFATRKFFRTVRGRLLTLALSAVLISSLSSVRLGGTPDLLSIAFNLVSEGLFAGHTLPGILEKLNSGQIDYEYGARILAGVLAFVPRIFWPSKDEFLYAGNQTLESVAPGGASNIVAEVLLQGGIVAVVLWFTVIGFMFERVHGSLRNFDAAIAARRLPASFFWYFVIVASFIPHFRDGLMPSIKIALQSGVFFLGVAGLRLLPTLTWSAVVRRPSPSVADSAQPCSTDL